MKCPWRLPMALSRQGKRKILVVTPQYCTTGYSGVLLLLLEFFQSTNVLDRCVFGYVWIICLGTLSSSTWWIHLKDIWLVGLVALPFLEICPENKRDWKTLEALIQKWLQVGTKILTDGWTGYKQLKKLDYIFGRFLCPSNDQNRRDGGAWIVVNDHLDNPASSVLLCSFANGHLQRGSSSGWPKHIFGRIGLKIAPGMSLV